MVKSAKAGCATVAIFTVVNGRHWAFQVPFYPQGPGERRVKTFADPDEAQVFAMLVANGKADHLDILRGFPLQRIYGLRGVGHKTRRELGRLFKELRERCPQIESSPGDSLTPIEQPGEGGTADNRDRIARLVATSTYGTRPSAEQGILQRFLGWVRDEKQPPAV
jgi:hypothetical protein